MTIICNALETTFTPATGTFDVACSGGTVRLDRRHTAGSPWSDVGFLQINQAAVVDNNITGTQYRFVNVGGPRPRSR